MNELLEQIADRDPMTLDASEESCCFYCGSGESCNRNVIYWHIPWETYMHPIYVRHADDCLWLKVRAATNRNADPKQYILEGLPGAAAYDYEVEDFEETLHNAILRP